MSGRDQAYAYMLLQALQAKYRAYVNTPIVDVMFPIVEYEFLMFMRKVGEDNLHPSPEQSAAAERGEFYN